jgi:hypothetical protein
MIWLVLLLSITVLVASYLRRPTALWQKAAVAIAVVALLAALVALGIEAMMQQEVS